MSLFYYVCAILIQWRIQNSDLGKRLDLGPISFIFMQFLTEISESTTVKSSVVTAEP